MTEPLTGSWGLDVSLYALAGAVGCLAGYYWSVYEATRGEVRRRHEARKKKP